jgi:uncharacterized membrane protein YfcA
MAGLPGADLWLLLGGALLASFVSGLSGFAFGLVSLSIWVWLLPLPELTPLLLFGSLAAQAMAIPRLLPEAQWSILRPMMLAAAIGVPLGVLALPHISMPLFRVGFGGLLLGFCLFQLLVGGRWRIADPGRWAEFLVGLAGGVLGGIAALSGALPAIWGVLRQWPMQHHRAVMVLYNCTCHAIGHVALWIAGLIDGTTILRFLLLSPCLLLGSWIGVRAWVYISPQRFREMILILLLASGGTLVSRGLWRAIAG